MHKDFIKQYQGGQWTHSVSMTKQPDLYKAKTAALTAKPFGKFNHNFFIVMYK